MQMPVHCYFLFIWWNLVIREYVIICKPNTDWFLPRSRTFPSFFSICSISGNCSGMSCKSKVKGNYSFIFARHQTHTVYISHRGINFEIKFDRPLILLDCTARFALQPWRETGQEWTNEYRIFRFDLKNWISSSNWRKPRSNQMTGSLWRSRGKPSSACFSLDMLTKYQHKKLMRKKTAQKIKSWVYTDKNAFIVYFCCKLFLTNLNLK